MFQVGLFLSVLSGAAATAAPAAAATTTPFFRFSVGPGNSAPTPAAGDIDDVAGLNFLSFWLKI